MPPLPLPGQPLANPLVALACHAAAEGWDEARLLAARDALLVRADVAQVAFEAVDALADLALTFDSALVLDRLIDGATANSSPGQERGIILTLMAAAWLGRAERDGPDAAHLAVSNAALAHPLLDPPPDERLTSNLIGICHQAGALLRDDGRTPIALVAYETAELLMRPLVAREPTTYDPAYAGILVILSDLLGRQGEQAASLAAAREAEAILRPLATRDPATYAAAFVPALFYAGKAFARGHDYVAARERYAEALALCARPVGLDPARLGQIRADLLNGLSDTLESQRAYPEALAAAREAVEILRPLATRDPAAYAGALSTAHVHRSDALIGLRDVAAALAAAREAEAILRPLLEHGEKYARPLATVLVTLGNVLSLLLDYAEALDAYERARAIYELLAKADPAGFNPALAGLLGNLGSTLGSQRRYAESVAVCEAALAIYEQLVARDAATYTPSLAMTLANLGTTFNRLPDYDRAIRTYERARAYYESLAAASPAIYGAPLAQVCNNLGAALNSKGEHAAALTAARAAVATLRPLAADNPSIYTPPYAGYLFNLGRALVGTGDREAAEAQYQEALMLCDDSVRRDGGQQPDVVAVRWRILAELGRLDDDLAARRRYFADALALLEEQRGLLANRDDRQAFQGEYATLYGEMVACCVALAAGLPPAARQDLLAEAWRWSERGRGRALLDLLGSPRPRLKTATQRQLFEDWEAARHAVDRALHEFSQAGAGADDRGPVAHSGEPDPLGVADGDAREAERRARWDALQRANDEEEALRRRVFLTIDGARQLAQVEIPPPIEMVMQLAQLTADGGAAGARPLLIEYTLLPATTTADRYAVFLVPLWADAAGQIVAETVELPAGALTQLLNDFAFARDLAEDEASADELSRAAAIWAALPARLGEALAGPWIARWLRPWAAAPGAFAPTALIVVAEGALQGVPLHAADLPALPGKEAQPLIAHFPLVTLPTAAFARTLTTRRSVEVRPDGWLVIGPHTYDQADPLYRAASNEDARRRSAEWAAEVPARAWQLARAWGHRDGPPFGDARMRVAALRELAGELAVLHLATHAAFESDDFLQSHIVFHGGERLTLGELFSDPRLDLRGMRLCYLSACHGMRAANELAGLAFALAYAGAEAVLASLWEAYDGPAAYLSRVFYTQWRRGSLTMAEAYRRAVLALREIYPNPRHWASCVLLGNGFARAPLARREMH